MSRAPIFVRVWNGHLVPADAYAQEQVAALEQGQEFNARLSRITATGREEREGMRGLWWAGLTLLSQNTEDARYDTARKAHEEILRGLGFVRPRWKIDGSVMMDVVSTADGAMDDDEFGVLQEKARGFVLDRFDYDPWQTWVDEQDALKANQQRIRK